MKEFAFLIAAVVMVVILITAVLAYSVDWLVQYIPYEYEKSIAASFQPEVSERNQVDDYLQSLADGLVKKMDMPEGMDITVHYVDQDVVNAMATLGGHVFVYRGLLKKLPHENALVMLLGHEMAHIKLRHPIKGLGKGVVIGLVLAALLGQSSDTVTKLLGNTSALTMLGFSREQEEDADEEGLIALQHYYHHVSGADDLFKVLLSEMNEQGVYVPQIMSSHPDTSKRIAHLHQMASSQHWPENRELKFLPRTIKDKITADTNAQ